MRVGAVFGAAMRRLGDFLVGIVILALLRRGARRHGSRHE
jgi:hypothetical protein